MRYLETEVSGASPTIKIDTKFFGELEDVVHYSIVKKSGRDIFYGIKTGGSIEDIPIIRDGMLFFGACDHNFYALDAETGREIWRFKTGGPIAGDGAGYENGTVFFSSFDGILYAVSARDGKEIWRFRTNSKLFHQIVHEGVVYFGSKDGLFYAVSANNGRELWRFRAKGAIMTPTVFGGKIYFGSWDRNVYALSLDGRLLWKLTFNDEIGWGIAADANGLCFGCKDYYLYFVSHDGRILWKFHTGGSIISFPLIHSGLVIFGSYDQNLYVVSEYTGKLVWKFATGNMLYGVPTFHQGMIYLGATDKNFYALTPEGKLAWKFKMNDSESNGGVGFNGKIYFGEWGCKMRCVSADSGKLIWDFKTSISHPSEVDVESELGTSFEVVISSAPEWSKEEEKYNTKQTTEIGEYQMREEGAYGSGMTYKAKRRYGGL